MAVVASTEKTQSKVNMELFRKKLRGGGALTSPVEPKSVPRCLFGAPTAAESDELMNKIFTAKAHHFKRRWNYDIVQGEPSMAQDESEVEKVSDPLEGKKFIWSEIEDEDSCNNEKECPPSRLAPLFIAPSFRATSEGPFFESPIRGGRIGSPESRFTKALECEHRLSPSPLSTPESPGSSLMTSDYFGTPTSRTRIRGTALADIPIDKKAKLNDTPSILSPESSSLNMTPESPPSPVNQTQFSVSPRQSYITDYLRSKKGGRAKKI